MTRPPEAVLGVSGQGRWAPPWSAALADLGPVQHTERPAHRPRGVTRDVAARLRTGLGTTTQITDISIHPPPRRVEPVRGRPRHLTRVELGFALALIAATAGLLLVLGFAERRAPTRTFSLASTLGARLVLKAGLVPADIARLTYARLCSRRRSEPVSASQIALLGAIAGFPIFLGLPIGRLRSPAPRMRALLNATAIGILLFLLWDVLTHAWEPLDEAVGKQSYGLAVVDGLVLGGGLRGRAARAGVLRPVDGWPPCADQPPGGCRGEPAGRCPSASARVTPPRPPSAAPPLARQ